MMEYNDAKCIFIIGTNLFWYNNAADRAESGPINIAAALPGVWGSGIDTGFKYNEFLYIFKGKEYVKFSIPENRVLNGYPMVNQTTWHGLSFATVDAAFYYPQNNKAYFFKGKQYSRYDMGADCQDANYPMVITAEWKGVFKEIDSASTWPKCPGKIYFFKGKEYMRYDFAADKVDNNYPMVTLAQWKGLTGGGQPQPQPIVVPPPPPPQPYVPPPVVYQPPPVVRPVVVPPPPPPRPVYVPPINTLPPAPVILPAPNVVVIEEGGKKSGSPLYPKKPDCNCNDRVLEINKARCIYCVIAPLCTSVCCAEPVLQCSACKKVFPEVLYSPF
jgi:hypothetical protein